MKTYTNMAWPDDPYRTGQQLYRRPAPRLAALTVDQAGRGNLKGPHAFAIVYLPMHPTQALAVTEQRLAFGFRAVSCGSGTEASVLAKVADLDLMQARRHAAVLAGYRLCDDLDTLQNSASDAVLRGVAAVAREWADRHAPTRGRAAMFDCGLDLPSAASLEEACARLGITSPTVHSLAEREGQHAAAIAVERALAIAIVSARHLGRYTWEGTLQTQVVMAANAWDCFPERLAGYERSVPDSRLG